MTDTVIDAPKVTVGFERKVSLRDYNSAVASVYVQANTKPEMTADELVSAIDTAMFQAKVTVFDSLGITFEVTPDGKAIELLEKELGAVEVVPSKAVEAVRSAPAQATANAAPGTKRALWEELCSNPKAWYDNREGKKNEKGPDFKRKTTGEALWLDFKGTPVKDRDGLTIPAPEAF